MKSVLSIIEELRSNNSRLFKEGVMEREVENRELKQAVYLTLNSTIQFYIRKIPTYTPSTPENAKSLLWGMDQLSELSSRTFTGHAGIAHLKNILSSLVEEDAKVIEMIIASDLDCGVSTATANKTWPGLLPEFPYMRCSQFKDIKKAKIDWSQGVFSQIKSDGAFTSITHTLSGEVIIATRSGNIYENPHFHDIVNEIKMFTNPGWQFHGELLVEEEMKTLPRETGNGILTSVMKGGKFGFSEVPVFVCWDAVPTSHAVTDGVYEQPYFQRLSRVENLFKETICIQVTESRIVYSLEEALTHYEELINLGLEGSIIKLHDAIWEDGTSKSQFKIKVDFNVELRIVSLNPGNGKNAKTFGSVKCVSEDSLLEVNVSGMKDKVRMMIWEQRDTIIDGIMEVKSNCIMKPKKAGGKHSLFLPRHVEIRSDKTVADTLQRIFDQFESVVKSVKS